MAAPHSGLSAQAMIKLETTVNTYAAPTSGLLLLDESIKFEKQKIVSNAIIATRRMLSTSQHYPGNETIAGPLHVELSDLGAEDALAMLLGAPVKTGAGPYVRTWAGPLDMYGVSATLQVGRPDDAGVVQPFTWTGCKAPSAEFGLAVGELVTLGMDVVAMNEIHVRTVTDGATTNTDATVTSATAVFTPDDVGKPISGTGIPAAATILSYTSATSVEISANATATATGVTLTIGVALASASYASGTTGFTFIGGAVTNNTVTVGSVTPPAIKKATIKVTRPQDTDRRGIGSARILQPIENDRATVGLELDCEFDGMTHYRRYMADSEHAAVLNLVSPAGNTLNFTMNGYYDAPTDPKVAGRDVLRQTISLDMAGATDAAAFTAVLTNTTA